MTAKIVMLTSGQPSLNPRLLKEADVLADLGYEVTVLYQYINDWATNYDQEIFSEKKWKAILVAGDPHQKKLKFFFSKIINKAALAICKINLYRGVAEIAISRVAPFLLVEAYKHKADFYIAHNLAALPVAVTVSKYYQAKCAFDAEDFHRQESSDDQFSFQYRIAKFLEDRYLPKLNYLTTASPLISKAYKDLYPNLNPVTINNVFPKVKLKSIPANTEILKLFWFSQNIGKNRGIETVLEALGILNQHQITFTLLGNVTTETKAYFHKIANANGLRSNQLIFLSPQSPNQIIQTTANYDIGMALEPGFCLNNKIALSNKLFTYIMAGIAVIVSETPAQLQFIKENPDIGKSFKIGNVKELVDIILNYINNPQELEDTKNASLEVSRVKFNWEIESLKLIQLVQEQLPN